MELHALFNNEQSLCLELNVIKNFEKIMKKAHADTIVLCLLCIVSINIWINYEQLSWKPKFWVIKKHPKVFLSRFHHGN
ncbi:hypothetical protein D3X38_14485 [Acinetobacter baumannii]|nr:hypothetical protein CJU83_06675 [Acinetobacter baumannii]KAA3496587.1 hypothetical protein CVG52_06365 [Acinetobacter baumannii]KAF0615889.1 hypothetical protein CLM70_06925 [Acinetobacter baumannii]KQK38242.1 hypothetical protein AQ481_07145 [Acinetobacter baumannii]KUI75672.1 hypothetical protein AQ480_17255 [Acinetobacter baumannii]